MSINEPTPATSTTSFFDRLAEYRKGLAGLLVPGLTVLGVALTGTSDGGSTVTATEWVSIAIASLVTGAVVTAVRNEPLR